MRVDWSNLSGTQSYMYVCHVVRILTTDYMYVIDMLYLKPTLLCRSYTGEDLP